MRDARSQSPYGAKWFATGSSPVPGPGTSWPSRNPLTGLGGLQLEHQVRQGNPRVIRGRNPLTGLGGLQRFSGAPTAAFAAVGVAIPLRG